MHYTLRSNNNLKPGLRANGAILPLALRPGLHTKLNLFKILFSSKYRLLHPIKAHSNQFVLSSLQPSLLLLLMIFGSLFINAFNNFPASASSVTLTIPSSALSLDISPNSGIVFQKSTAGTINVATDSSYGYSLSIHAKNGDSDSAKSNDLLNGSNKIASIVSALNESDFQNSGSSNTWGYMPSKLNSSANSDFQPGPTSEPTTLDVTDTSSSGTDYGIILATKIDNSLPAGTYHNTFILTTITNDPPAPTTFQDFGNYCDQMSEEQSLTLMDTRDNNLYRIGKLKDGNCWMLQELRIMDKEISSADSDMLDSDGTYKIPSSDNTKFISSDNNNDAAYYYEDNEDDNGYYTWYTATAGTGTTDVTDRDATSSICPKGWRLPRGGAENIDTNELATLVKAYGGDGLNHTDGGQQAVLDELVSPAFPNFIYAGYVGNVSGALTYYGTGGRYWSSTARSSANAYGLYYDASNSSLAPSNSTQKQSGRPVRCLAASEPRVTINYHLNSGTGGPTTPSTQRAFSSKITIDSVQPTRVEHAFLGWCDQFTDSSDCLGKMINPDETYEVKDQTTVDLYAIWKKIGSLQTVDQWGDSVLANMTGSSYDTRDGKTYTVGRLADGHLWMTQNLALGKEGSTIELTPSDTDISSNYTLPASSTSGFSSHTAANVYIDPQYGGYYTYVAATAGTGASVTTKGEQAPSSVCPKGWRLPTKDEYNTLSTAYGGDNSTGSTNLRATPANFVFAGHMPSYAINVYGFYWSSTAYDSSYAFEFFMDSDEAKSSFNGFRHDGNSVRCVSRTDDPLTMQTVENWGSEVQKGETKTAIDTRDNKEYTVARLDDNKLWMTKNLEIENYTLTSADSDVSTDFDLPASNTSGFSSYDVSNVYIDSTYGGYYTWFAATAGDRTQNKSSGETSYSICPKGWKLPTKNEYDKLVSDYNASSNGGTLQADPLNFLKGGYYSDSSPHSKESDGRYWSSTAPNNTYAWYLLLDDSSAKTALYENKPQGFSVRCISRQ